MLFPSTVRPLIGAHRGASADAPENTLAAFDLALEQGAELIEFDVHRTRDGELVVLHDFSPRRTTNGAGTIVEQTLAELKSLDAGAWRGPRWAGQRIPTLAEVLNRYGDRVYLNIEIKVDQVPYQRIEQEVAAAIRERGLYDRIVVSSFDFATIGRLRQFDPQIRTALLTEEHPDEALRVALELGAVGVHPASSLIGPAVVAKADERGLGILAWTVDSEPEMKRLLAFDIDAIVSNVPAVLRRVVMDYRQGQ